MNDEELERNEPAEPSPEPSKSRKPTKKEMCNICYTDTPLSKLVACGCGTPLCRECVRTTLLHSVENAQCPHCHNAFNRDFLQTNLGKSWYTTTYRKHIKTIFFDREKARFPETTELIAREKRANNEQRRLEKLKDELKSQIQRQNGEKVYNHWKDNVLEQILKQGPDAEIVSSKRRFLQYAISTLKKHRNHLPNIQSTEFLKY